MSEDNQEQLVLDIYADASPAYVIKDEARDADGNLLVTIEVNGKQYMVRNGEAATRAEVLETCARTAQEIRINTQPKQQ
jgi:hypothetical protein